MGVCSTSRLEGTRSNGPSFLLGKWIFIEWLQVASKAKMLLLLDVLDSNQLTLRYDSTRLTAKLRHRFHGRISYSTDDNETFQDDSSKKFHSHVMELAGENSEESIASTLPHSQWLKIPSKDSQT